jgi:hypothetical protein
MDGMYLGRRLMVSGTRFYAALYTNIRDGIFHVGIRLTLRSTFQGLQIALGPVTISIGVRHPLPTPLQEAQDHKAAA